MKASILRSVVAAISLLTAVAANAMLLYDADLDTLPSAQGWTNGGLSGSVNGGVYHFDTTPDFIVRGGNLRVLGDGTLDTAFGFEFGLGLGILAENHGSNANRAGFSFLFVGDSAAHALEVAFWEDEIWVYALGPDFIHGAGAAASTSGQHDYRIRVQAHQFKLFQDHNLLLSGPMVDYRPAITSLERLVYGIPNLVFVGDDTRSASAGIELSYVSLSAVPLPAAWLLFAPAAAALFAGCRRQSPRGRQS